MSFVVYKHEEGISLNPREYLLEKPNGDWIIFPTEKQAKKFLTNAGIDPVFIDDGIFIESLKDAKEWEGVT